MALEFQITQNVMINIRLVTLVVQTRSKLKNMVSLDNRVFNVWYKKGVHKTMQLNQ